MGGRGLTSGGRRVGERGRGWARLDVARGRGYARTLRARPWVAAWQLPGLGRQAGGPHRHAGLAWRQHGADHHGAVVAGAGWHAARAARAAGLHAACWVHGGAAGVHVAWLHAPSGLHAACRVHGTSGVHAPRRLHAAGWVHASGVHAPRRRHAPRRLHAARAAHHVPLPGQRRRCCHGHGLRRASAAGVLQGTAHAAGVWAQGRGGGGSPQVPHTPWMQACGRRGGGESPQVPHAPRMQAVCITAAVTRLTPAQMSRPGAPTPTQPPTCMLTACSIPAAVMGDCANCSCPAAPLRPQQQPGRRARQRRRASGGGWQLPGSCAAAAPLEKASMACSYQAGAQAL